MASFRFIIPLLLAAGVDAHVQVSLSAPKPQAFEVFAERFKKAEYPNHPFVGNVPWYPYAMELGVGTPAQMQSVVVALSRSDAFILYSDLCNPSDNPNVTDYVRDCSSGAFDDEASSTFTYNSSDIYSTTSGRWFDIDGVMMQDTLSIGDAQMRNASLGLAIYTSFDTGIFGLSTPWGQRGGYIIEGRTAFLDQMANQNLINSPAFSIYPERGNGTTGSILFGAVDKSKYDGKLQRIQASVGRDVFSVNGGARDDLGYRLRSVSGYFANVSAAWLSESSDDEGRQYVEPGDDGGATFYPKKSGTFYASIDPTFTLTNVPHYVADPIYQMLRNVSIWSNIGLWTVDCSSASSLNGSFTLELGGEGGYRVTANLRDLVVPAEQWHILEPIEEGSTEYSKQCLLGIQSTDDSSIFYYDASDTRWVIGSLVLGNTYMVFDSKNMEVSLAPVSKGSEGKQQILPFESSGAHAPDSEFVGYAECFNKDCGGAGKDDEPDAGARIVLQKGLLVTLVLGGMGLIVFG